MVVTCVIEFANNPCGTYYAGQVMTGNVTLQVDKPKKVKGIVLKISGSADTSWEDTTSERTTDVHGNSKDESRTIHYRGHEDYIKSKTNLLGSVENQQSVIEPGIHTYTFACHLPHTCPSSFEGFYGHIRYLVKVELVRPWKFDQTFTKGFTVLKVMDLNYDSPLLRVPSHSEAQKIFCCGPCKTQPLNIHVSLPQTGYVPGQMLPVAVEIQNETNIRVEELKVELVMLVCYYSQVPRADTKNERIVVTKVKGEGVAVYCKKQFQYPLILPATPPTCFNLCRIIQIAYQVEVEVKVKGWHTNQIICVPVTVGNVPLMNVIQKQPKAIGNTATNASGEERALENSETKPDDAVPEGSIITADSAIMTSTPPSPWSADSSIPPPTYEAAVHMKPGKINDGEAHDYGETEFAPRYPVFSIPSPSAPCIDAVDGVRSSATVQPNGDTTDIDAKDQKSTWL